MISIDELIARTLGITPERVTDDLEYQSIREWDSLGHVSLMVALEGAYGVGVNDELMLELRTVKAIRNFAARGGVAQTPDPTPAPQTETVRRGLEGVVFDRTCITRIDGGEGVLEYRGYGVPELADKASFEEVAYLLVYGSLPGAAALPAFSAKLRAYRTLPEPVVDLARALAGAHPAQALRTLLSALGSFGPSGDTSVDETYEEALESGIALIARVPLLVAAHHAFRSGREFTVPMGEASYAESLLATLLGERPSAAAVRAIEKGLIVHADHGSNASAFTARVAIGCRSGMPAALTAAVAAFSGSVHGGAIERAARIVDEVGTPANAERYVAALHEKCEPVMGFGHRVYRTEDPRVKPLRATVVELSEECDDHTGLAILDAVATAMLPYSRHGVAPNVDLYAGLAYRLLGLPDDLAIALFAIGRTVGWVAQALEQHANNVLIRPLLEYAGPRGLSYPAAG